jgi:hypothetical protein
VLSYARLGDGGEDEARGKVQGENAAKGAGKIIELVVILQNYKRA